MRRSAYRAQQYAAYRKAERERFRCLSRVELLTLETMIMLYGRDRIARHCGIGVASLERVRVTGRVHTGTIILTRDGVERWLRARGEVQ